MSNTPRVVKYSIPCDKEGRRKENAAQQEVHGICTNGQLTQDGKQPCARNFVSATPVSRTQTQNWTSEPASETAKLTVVL